MATIRQRNGRGRRKDNRKAAERQIDRVNQQCLFGVREQPIKAGIGFEDIYYAINAARSGDTAQLDQLKHQMGMYPYIAGILNRHTTHLKGLQRSIEPACAYRDPKTDQIKTDRDPTDEELRGVEVVEAVMSRMCDLGGIFGRLGFAYAHGYQLMACANPDNTIGWNWIDGFLVPTYQWRNNNIVIFHPENLNDIRLRLYDSGAYGEPPMPHGWLIHTHAYTNDYTCSNSLFTSLLLPWIITIHALFDGSDYLRRGFQPNIYGMYDASNDDIDEDDLKRYERQIKKLREASYALIPNSIELIIKEMGKAGTIKDFDDRIRLMHKLMAIAITSNTLTVEMDSSGGSYAAASEHAQISDVISRSVVLGVENTLNQQLIRNICDFNLVEGVQPKFFFNIVEDQTIEEMAAEDKAILEVGFELTDEGAQERYGSNYQRVEQVVQTMPVTPMQADSGDDDKPTDNDIKEEDEPDDLGDEEQEDSVGEGEKTAK